MLMYNDIHIIILFVGVVYFIFSLARFSNRAARRDVVDGPL